VREGGKGGERESREKRDKEKQRERARVGSRMRVEEPQREGRGGTLRDWRGEGGMTGKG